MPQVKAPRPGSGHTFAQVPKVEIRRSQFDRSSGFKTTFDAGYLIPIYVDEALPGDTFNLSMNGFVRLATPVVPIMDNLYLDTFFFAIPNRLVWNNWERFNGEKDNPTDSVDYTVPVLSDFTASELSLADYMGLPVGVELKGISALPFRAMVRVWNEWFRDENLQGSAIAFVDDGPDSYSDYTIFKRGKRHDYFTSCLPWPQKPYGSMDEVEIPLGSKAPVSGIGLDPNVSSAYPAADAALRDSTGAPLSIYPHAAQVGSGWFIRGTSANEGHPDIYADLSQATAISINDLRMAVQLQRLLERDARGGTRYTEILKAHFGVTSPDARLQRTEYLGGGTANIIVSPIAQTSSTDTTTPQGNLAAMGTGSWSGHGFRKSFTEHCIILGFACVRADLNYQQGIERMWTRQTRFDFFWPALAGLGEQAVLNREIYATGLPDEMEVFGYQERYGEYRYKPSKITGRFRSQSSAPLHVWHLAQDFDSMPNLNAAFIVENPPMQRIKAVTDEPDFLMDAWFKVHCARPMPLYGVPGLMDHF